LKAKRDEPKKNKKMLEKERKIAVLRAAWLEHCSGVWQVGGVPGDGVGGGFGFCALISKEDELIHSHLWKGNVDSRDAIPLKPLSAHVKGKKKTFRRRVLANKAAGSTTACAGGGNSSSTSEDSWKNWKRKTGGGTEKHKG